MGYNNLNKLDFVEKVQKVVQQYKDKGGGFLESGKYVVYTYKYIYKTFIREEFNISYSAYNNYLGINVSREREKTKERLAAKLSAKLKKEAEKKRQLELEF